MGAALAADDVPVLSIGLSPLEEALDLRAGETGTFTALFRCEGNQPVRVSVQVKDTVYHKDAGWEYLDPGGEIWSAGSWLAVEPAEFDLAPGEKQELGVTVTVPGGTPDGEYYATLFTVARRADQPEGAPGVGLQGSIGCRVSIATGEGLERLARFVPYSSVPRQRNPGGSWLQRLGQWLTFEWRSLVIDERHVALVAEGHPLRLFVPIENIGAAHIQPRVTATFKQGDTVLQQVIASGAIVVPEESEVIEMQWPLAPALGVYQVELTVEYGGQEPLQADTTFAIFPVKGALGLIILAFGLGYFAAARRRRLAARGGPGAPTAGA